MSNQTNSVESVNVVANVAAEAAQPAANPAPAEAVENAAEATAAIRVKTTIKSVRLVEYAEYTRFRVTFGSAFTGIKKIDGEYVEGDVDYVEFVPRAFIAQVLDKVGDLEPMYSHQKERATMNNEKFSFGAPLNVVLKDASVVLERAFFAAGEEYTMADGSIAVHAYDGYTTRLVDVKITDRAQKLLDKFIDSMFTF